MKNKFIILSLMLILSGINLCSFADNVYIINNNMPAYPPQTYNQGIMCSDYNAVCTSGHYVMSTSRVVYAPSEWKRPTIRERRLAKGLERIPYSYKQAYNNKY